MTPMKHAPTIKVPVIISVTESSNAALQALYRPEFSWFLKR